jgi:hypothetical protein
MPHKGFQTFSTNDHGRSFAKTNTHTKGHFYSGNTTKVILIDQPELDMGLERRYKYAQQATQTRTPKNIADQSGQ